LFVIRFILKALEDQGMAGSRYNRYKKVKIFPLTVRPEETTLYCSKDVNWGTEIIPLISNKQVVVRVLGYSIYSHSGVGKNIFDQVQGHLYFIFNRKYEKDIVNLKYDVCGNEHPLSKKVSVAVHPDIHSKVILIEPDIMYVSSANFPCTASYETTIKIRSQEAHDTYARTVFDPLWSKSSDLCKCFKGVDKCILHSTVYLVE